MGIFSRITLEVAEQDGHLSTHLINHDIAPMPPSRRTWGWTEYIGFYFIADISLSNWSGASALLALGLTVWEVCIIKLISATLIFLVAGANGWVGGDWHIGFTVFQRVIFGIFGSYIGIVIRIVLSIVSYASQAWLGGLCMAAILSSWSHSFLMMENTLPESAHMVTRDLIGFTIFQLISIPFLFVRPERVINPVKIASIVAFICMLGITIWATKTGGHGPLMKQGESPTTFTRSWAWFYGITSSLGGIAAGLLNQADFTRFTTKQGHQIPGLVGSVYLPGMAIPVMGLITASATVNIWGEQYWNPVDILIKWMVEDYSATSRIAAFLCGLGFVYSQLAFNIIANGFAAGMDLAGMLPKYIDIRRGSLLCAALSWAVQPWLIWNTSSKFIATLSAFSVFLAPLTGIMITDYFFLRKRRIELSSLYTLSPEGSYYFTYGFNWRAILVWVVIFVPAMPGMISTLNTNVKVSEWALYYYYGNYTFGFLEASALYYLLVRFFPPEGMGKQDTHDIFGTFTREEAEEKGIIPFSFSNEASSDDETAYLLREPDKHVNVAAITTNENITTSI